MRTVNGSNGSNGSNGKNRNKLTRKNYVDILHYYDISIPKTLGKIRGAAENVMANKLCRCIKRVRGTGEATEGRAIGICTKSIFTNRGYTRKQFRCKGSRSVKIGIKSHRRRTQKHM